MKTIIIRFINGFCYGIAITMVVQLLIMTATGNSVLLPEYEARFANPLMAYCVQLLLIGCMSGIASAGGVILELKRPGLILQSLLYLLLMLLTWIPIACYLWSFHKYLLSMVSSLLSIFVTYGICWGIQYKICKQDIHEINKHLTEIRRSSHDLQH